MSEPEILAVPPLRSGGIMLSYQCNLTCRHCNYRCRPGAGDWMSEAVLEETLETLKRERRLVDVHIAGGEPTLNRPLLEKAVGMTIAKGIRLSYVETNGWFATSPELARETLKPLRDAGLPAILLSISPYHNETIPLRTTLNCLEAGMEVFGEDGIFPWLGHFIPMIAKLGHDEPHPLEAFLEANGLDKRDGSLFRLFPLTPGGRVPEGLGDFFTRRPAADFAGGHCFDTLTGVTHFHVDPSGNLFTGHCPGIVSGRTPDFHLPKTMAENPVFCLLATGGPHALMEAARSVCGFIPDPRGYVSPCDLCFQVRRALRARNPGDWPELEPAEFYGP